MDKYLKKRKKGEFILALVEMVLIISLITYNENCA